MPAKVRIGHGTTIEFATSGLEANVEFKTIGQSGISREPIDTTHLSSPAGTAGKMGGRTYLASPIASPGQLALGFHLNPDEVLPVNEPPEAITITFPLQAGEVQAAKWEFTGFVVDADYEVETEAVIEGTMTVQISGEITVTPATTS